MATGALTPLGLAAEAVNPSFLAIHPNQRFLYAVTEASDFRGQPGGAVGAFRIQPETGKLTSLNHQSSGGAGPCHLVVDQAGKQVLVANYGGGSVSVLPIRENGELGEATAFIQHAGSSKDPRRQQAPHAHSINLDRANRFAVAADLGLDKVMIYRFDSESGTLTPNNPPWATVEPGSGPRHFAFHPEGRFAYVINEMSCTVTAFTYAPGTGTLSTIQTISTLPDGQDVERGFSTAEVQVHPSGKFLYGSNRGHNSIAAYSIDPATGKLTYLENEPTQGSTPRNFGIDPTGKFLLAENQSSGSIVVFRINSQSGHLEPTGHRADVPNPVCVKFVQEK
jgi:6-phosphogluconolactonase